MALGEIQVRLPVKGAHEAPQPRKAASGTGKSGAPGPDPSPPELEPATRDHEEVLGGKGSSPNQQIFEQPTLSEIYDAHASQPDEGPHVLQNAYGVEAAGHAEHPPGRSRAGSQKDQAVKHGRNRQLLRQSQGSPRDQHDQHHGNRREARRAHIQGQGKAQQMDQLPVVIVVKRRHPIADHGVGRLEVEQASRHHRRGMHEHEPPEVHRSEKPGHQGQRNHGQHARHRAATHQYGEILQRLANRRVRNGFVHACAPGRASQAVRTIRPITGRRPGDRAARPAARQRSAGNDAAARSPLPVPRCAARSSRVCSRAHRRR